MLHTLSNCIFVRIIPTQKTGVCKDKKVMLRFPPQKFVALVFVPLFSSIKSPQKE